MGSESSGLRKGGGRRSAVPGCTTVQRNLCPAAGDTFTRLGREWRPEQPSRPAENHRQSSPTRQAAWFSCAQNRLVIRVCLLSCVLPEGTIPQAKRRRRIGLRTGISLFPSSSLLLLIPSSAGETLRLPQCHLLLQRLTSSFYPTNGSSSITTTPHHQSASRLTPRPSATGTRVCLTTDESSNEPAPTPFNSRSCTSLRNDAPFRAMPNARLTC